MSVTLNTITGEHYLGEAPDMQALYADGYTPRWVKFVTDANYVANRAQFLPPGTNVIWRLFERAPFHSNKIAQWQGSDAPGPSARRLVNHLNNDLRTIASIPGRLKAWDGPFNEVGHGEWYAKFCFELARILWHEYDGLLLAAFGSSTGSYNEAQHAQVMAEHFVKPCIAAGIPVYFSLHAYASLLPMVWHGKHRQAGDVARIWFDTNQTGDLLGWDDFMGPGVLDDASGPPRPTFRSMIGKRLVSLQAKFRTVKTASWRWAMRLFRRS